MNDKHKEIRNTWLVGRLTKIIKELSGLDVEVVYGESVTEMAYTTSTATQLTFKWANGERTLHLDYDKARWNDGKRAFNFSREERTLHKIAKDMIMYISKQTSMKCKECGCDADEFVECRDESKKHKSCGAVWCVGCYEKSEEWFHESEDALPVADGVIVNTDLCPKCASLKLA